MPRAFIPNTDPWITDREIEAVARCLREGRLASERCVEGAGDALRQCTRGHEVLLTTSCTTAMELALSCLELQRDDEVIVPSFTFVTTANAVTQQGATPVLVDIDEDTWNIDIEDCERKRTSHTRALIPVHYNSISCDMNRLLTFAKTYGIVVVEDAAHALDASYHGIPLGTLGDFGCYSFHTTKNIVCGEGGALVINNPAYTEQAEWRYEKGTNRSSFLRGEVDKYTWVSKGSSYALAGILAELLRVQLLRREEIQAARRKICKRYEEGLASLAEEGYIRFQVRPAWSTPSYHMACFCVEDPSQRDPLLRHLKHRSIGAIFHYIPLHLSPYGRERLKYHPGDFPIAEKVAASIVRLPLYPHLPHTDCDYIIDQVHAFFHPTKKARAIEISAEADDSAPATIDFTLVLPCFNEAPHLHRNLREILQVLDHMALEYEIILIDDCSTDETPLRMEEFIAKHQGKPIRAFFHRENRGRGATVTEGIQHAKGRIVGFLDIDLEVHARYIPSAIIALEQGRADMVLGERSYKFSLSAWQRWLMSKGYRWLVRTLLGTPALDTEAGFKFFRREAILPLLPLVHDSHWFWDTAITIGAYDRGLRIRTEPVLFVRKQSKASTVNACRDSWHSLLHLLRFRTQRQRFRTMA